MSEVSHDVGTKFLFENERVKVWHLIVEAGEATPWHEHQRDYMYIVIDAGKVRTEYKDGTYGEQNDKPGDVVIMKRDHMHQLVNLGSRRYVNVVIELKQ